MSGLFIHRYGYVKLFSVMYDATMRWAHHPKAVYALGLLSFAESSFFPIPPDVMLAPMALAEPRKAWRLALITTIASVLGGMMGYVIGVFLFDAITPWLHQYGYWDKYLTAQTWFSEWGFWAMLLAGFSPIPYKVFTIAGGVAGMSLAPFVAASVLGRGARFYLVSGLMRWGGAPMEQKLRQHIDWLGWGTVVVAAIAYLLLR